MSWNILFLLGLGVGPLLGDVRESGIPLQRGAAQLGALLIDQVERMSLGVRRPRVGQRDGRG